MTGPPDDPTPPTEPAFAPGSGFSLGFVDATIGDDATAPPAAENAAAGAPYVLTELIGVGGQGEVWEAWQPSLRRTVAVKIHHSGSAERFAREALLTGALEHPSIVPVLDFGALVQRDAAAPAVAMAMKRLRGHRWDELIERDHASGALPAPDGLARHFAILEAVCQAVAFAHARGVLHLDLKPSQVIVGEFGETYLCDWGMAARMGAEPGELDFVAAPNGPFGTPPFMAPEQALGDIEAVGVATDVYLAAGLAYFVLAGRHPHPGDEIDEVLRAARSNRIAPLAASLPASIVRVVMKGLSVAPRDRFESIEALRRAIADALRRAEQETEAAAIREEAARALDATLAYPELAALEQRLDRARALAPDDPATEALRDRVLARHASLAAERGDLALAAVTAGRIAAEPERARLRADIADREDAVAQRERQRIRARRRVVVLLASLVVVLVVSSTVLYLAVQRIKGEQARTRAEQARTEAALADSRRELALASLQAAMGHLDKQRPADARAALMRVPQEWRHWEWGYLASRAVPEAWLVVERSTSVEAFATLRGGDFVAVIDPETKGMMARATQPMRYHPETTPGRWTAAASSASETFFAGTESGEVSQLYLGRIRESYQCGTAAITRIAHAEGTPAYATDADGVLWRIGDAGERLADLGGEATSLEVSSRGVAIGTRDGAVWHARHGEVPIASAFRHSAPVAGIRFHPDGERFVTWAGGLDVPGSGDSRGAVHRIGEAAPLHVTLDVETPLTAAAWSPDGDTLALAFANLWLHEFRADDWSLARSSQYGIGIAHDIRYIDEGRALAFVSRTMLQARETQWMGPLISMRGDSRRIRAWAWEGDRLFITGEDGGLTEWRFDRATDAFATSLNPDRILSLDTAATTETFAALHRWGWSKSWRLDGEPAPFEPGYVTDFEAMQVRTSADGSRIVQVAADGRLEIVAMPEARVLRAEQLAAPLRAVAMHPSGGHAVVAVADRLVRVPAESGEPVRDLAAATGEFTALHFPRLAETLVAAESPRDAAPVIRVLDGAATREIRRLAGHGGAVRRMATDPKVKWLAAACDDETAHVWNLATGEHLHALRGSHAGAVVSVAFTRDGVRVITGCADSLVRVFDRASGIELVALQGHEFAITDLALAHDGRRLVTSGIDGSLRVWLTLDWTRGDDVFRAGPWR